MHKMNSFSWTLELEFISTLFFYLEIVFYLDLVLNSKAYGKLKIKELSATWEVRNIQISSMWLPELHMHMSDFNQ